jgi:2-C-methyl-D-erythritol 4-phosphate cytidylyltransferase
LHVQAIAGVKFEKMTKKKILCAIPFEVLLCARRGMFVQIKKLLDIPEMLEMLAAKFDKNFTDIKEANEFQKDIVSGLENSSSGSYASYCILIARIVALSECLIKPISRYAQDKQPRRKPIIFDEKAADALKKVKKFLEQCKKKNQN